MADDKDLSDEQVDALLNEEKSADIPMESQTDDTPLEYTLKVNGKEIKAPVEKVLQWAQMGYDYPQRSAELKKQQDDFQNQLKEKEKYWSELENKWKPYKEVDEYASKNPDWWSQVSEQYKQKTAVDSENPALKEVNEKLQKYDDFINSQKAKEESLKVEQEDKALESEIDSIRKTYDKIDFDTPDDGGNSLQMKVLKHAVENDIKSFKTAFRDYYHDHLVGKAKEEGKEIVSKDIQKRTKLGILGESSKPSKGLTVATNVRSKSYNDLEREALDELKQGLI